MFEISFLIKLPVTDILAVFLSGVSHPDGLHVVERDIDGGVVRHQHQLLHLHPQQLLQAVLYFKQNVPALSPIRSQLSG